MRAAVMNPLDAVREAHLRMQSCHARGKIVIRP